MTSSITPKCPSSGTISNCIRNYFVECFAITTTFSALQFIVAKHFQKPTRVPALIGAILPLSYYTITIMDHHAISSDQVIHSAKNQRQRQLLITLIVLLVIRSYENTSYAISYRWGIVTLIAAKLMVHLPQMPRSTA